MTPHGAQQRHAMYWKLALELAIDFVVMYLVMYTMIDTIGHLYLNINNVYMTLMMVAPMAVLMLVSMRAMFPRRELDASEVTEWLNNLEHVSPLVVYMGGREASVWARKASASPSRTAAVRVGATRTAAVMVESPLKMEGQCLKDLLVVRMMEPRS